MSGAETTSSGPGPRDPEHEPGPTGSLETSEIHALLSELGPRTPDAATTEHARSTEWREVDFSARCRELSSREVRRLLAECSAFGAAVSTRLRAFLARPVVVELVSVGVVDFAEFCRGQPDPASVHVVLDPDSAERHALAISPRLLLSMVGALLGETSSHEDGPFDPLSSRGLTRLEEEIGHSVLAEILLAESDAWSLADGMPGSELRLERTAKDLQEVDVSRPADPVAMALFSVRVGERHAVEGDLHLAIPPGEFLSRLLRPSPTVPRATTRAIGGYLDLSVFLQSKPLAIADLAALRPGDVIDSGIEANAPVKLRVQDSAVGKGRLGTKDGRLALKISGR